MMQKPLIKKTETQSLQEMNQILISHSLSPLARTGVDRDGWNILSISRIDLNAWYAIVEFLIKKPDGNIGQFFMKFSVGGKGKRNCCVIALITDEHNEKHLVFSRQHRPSLLTHEESGRAWPNEFPREFAITNLSTISIAKSAGCEPQEISILGRELTPLMTSDLVTIESRTLLSDVPDDTGMSTTFVDYWLVQMKTNNINAVREKNGTRRMQIRYIPLKDVMRNRKKCDIDGAHTLTGLLLLYEHLNLF